MPVAEARMLGFRMGIFCREARGAHGSSSELEWEVEVEGEES